MVEWTLTRDEVTIETNLYDVELLDSANTFGDELIAKIDDVNGTRFDEYRRGTRVDLEVNSISNVLTINRDDTQTVSSGDTEGYTSVRNAGTYENAGTVRETQDDAIRKFSGYIVERREIEQGGADALELTAYTFDQFLRRNKVSADLSGLTIADALESIITNDTPITFNSSNIEVGDEQELTRSYRGDPVEQTLQDLAFKSNDENFGVNDNLEFFFRPRETKHIDRGIDDTQWFNTDIPERGKEAINEVEVWFDDGDESVIVDDGGDKLDLQNSLGLDDPGKQKAEITREELTDISDAEDEGRKYLNFRNNTLSGQITTFGLYDAEPGDTIDVTISTQGIDTEFQIAEVEYRWGTDETILTVVEKRGDNDDVLLRLTEAVSRVEMRPSDRDAPKNRITTTDAQAIINTTATDSVEGEISSDRFTNLGRNLIRDSWAAEAIDPIDTLVVGDDASGLSRSNESLRNQTNSFAVSPSLDGSKGVKFTATVGESINELGLETASGELVYRAVIPDGLSASDITVNLTVTDDDTITRGVITNDGQTAVRDILADNSPVVPDEYAYGSGTTDPQVSDTTLESEVTRESLSEILIQDADSTTQWNGITPDFAADEPLTVESGALKTQRITEFKEGEPAGTDADNNWSGESDGDYSAGAGGSPFAVESGFAQWEITIPYDIPADEVGIAVRDEIINANDSIDQANNSWTFNGNEIDSVTIGSGGSKSIGWIYLGDNGFYTGGGYSGGDLSGGETYTLEFSWNGSVSGGITDYFVDCVAVYDQRYIRNDGSFDDTVDGNNTLADPVLFSELVEVSLNTANTQRDLTTATFDSTWNNTDNEQYVELANDGSTFTRFNNSDTGSVTFADADKGVDTNIGISHFASDTTTTPRNGDSGQEVDVWQLFSNPAATVSDGIGVALTRGIVPPGSITGSTLREAGLFGDSILLTRHIFAEFTVGSNTRVASAESTRFTGDE